MRYGSNLPHRLIPTDIAPYFGIVAAAFAARVVLAVKCSLARHRPFVGAIQRSNGEGSPTDRARRPCRAGAGDLRRSPSRDNPSGHFFRDCYSADHELRVQRCGPRRRCLRREERWRGLLAITVLFLAGPKLRAPSADRQHTCGANTLNRSGTASVSYPLLRRFRS